MFKKSIGIWLGLVSPHRMTLLFIFKNNNKALKIQQAKSIYPSCQQQLIKNCPILPT